jgi:ribosomal protein S18 acetylase RimI-like enzyme
MIVSKRQATETDHQFARSMHHRAYRDVIERQYGPWDEAEADRLFDAVWIAAAHEIVLCDSTACGYCRIECGDDDIYIRELVIDPDFQNRGIGTHIMESVFKYAASRAVPVRLQTQLLNRAANLYRRLGFLESGRTDRHIVMEWRAEGFRG